MTQIRRWARAYVVGVVLLGAATIAYSVHRLYVDPIGPQWFVLAALTLLTGFGQSLDHPLRLGVTFLVVTGLYGATRVLTLGVRAWWLEQSANWRHGLT